MPPKPCKIMPQIMPKILHMVALHCHHTATSACSLKYQAQNYLALGSSITQLLLNVDGEAGTGKTFTLLKACVRIQEIATVVREGNPVFQAAPTGIAAFNIIGKTLHSLLRLPVKTKKTDLSPGTLQSLQASFSS